MRGIGFFLTEGLAYDEREKRRLRELPIRVHEVTVVEKV